MSDENEVKQLQADSASRPESRPDRPASGSRLLNITTPYTTPELTLTAMRHAGVCADLNIHVFLIDVQEVPYPCALDHPPVDRMYSRKRLQRLFEEAGVPGSYSVLYARDRIAGFRQALRPGSLIIIAAKERWWPTPEARLARMLKAAGHEVLLLTKAR
jgi:hypothetical protein